jgi:hypothetical protein
MIRLTLSIALTTIASADDLASIIAVQREAAGNEAAAGAWKKIVSTAKGDELPTLLAAMDGANPLAQNWLRAAVSAVEQREGDHLPIAQLKDFIAAPQHDPGARTLAFDLLQRHSKTDAEGITPALLNDPSAELRRRPVAALIEEGRAALAKDSKPTAITAFTSALRSARDEDQIKVLAKELRALGQNVDLPTHFGFLMDWKVIAPFSNADRKGFDTAYPPETELNFDASYPGAGKEAKWVNFRSEDEYGKINFNKPFDMLKSVVGYAATTFTSATERDAELRIGSKNGWKIWLNGQELFARDEYHRGAKLDQYKLPCHLKAGANTLLVKCCQNEQTETWTVEWEFQLRICDATGTAILSAN